MKKLIFFIIILTTILFSCSMQDIREENLKRPSFEFQKTYLLKQHPGDFITFFNVWKNYPVDITEFVSLEEINAAKAFTARQKITLVLNKYIIKDLIKKDKYLLEQNYITDNPDRLIHYTLSKNNEQIAFIRQVDKYNILDFELYKDNKKYEIKGEIKKIGINIHSIEFTIKHEQDTMGIIYKQLAYFTNDYEIYINRGFKNISDPEFICFGVFLNQVLKENGYKYK